jgi:hypothetical protein
MKIFAPSVLRALFLEHSPHPTRRVRSIVQGDATAINLPFICRNLPNFVELRGGDYSFCPVLPPME